MKRRTLLAALPSLALVRRGVARAQDTGSIAFGYPITLPDRVPGDGFIVRHGYACENTWYNPGWWHTGEDWYLIEGDTAGVPVVAVAGGEVVFAGYDYPGPVVIVRHADDLYSVYGHLDDALAVATGDTVVRGQQLGTVLNRTDGRAPSHVHFELRTFFTTSEVNGDAPRYTYSCGVECPPGPGYWPIDAPEHPSAMGWRNPMHVIARHSFPDGVRAAGSAVIVAAAAAATAAVWSGPPARAGAAQIGELALEPGTRYPLLDLRAGQEDTTGTSAESYRLWYRLALAEGDGWVQAAAPSTNDTGSDGRPSSVRFDLLPAVATAG